MKIIDSVPLWMFALAAVFMSLAPIYPQPHLLEKFFMLMAGNLTRPMDIFDVFWHLLFPVLLIVKIVRMSKAQA